MLVICWFRCYITAIRIDLVITSLKYERSFRFHGTRPRNKKRPTTIFRVTKRLACIVGNYRPSSRLTTIDIGVRHFQSLSKLDMTVRSSKVKKKKILLTTVYNNDNISNVFFSVRIGNCVHPNNFSKQRKSHGVTAYFCFYNICNFLKQELETLKLFYLSFR